MNNGGSGISKKVFVFVFGILALIIIWQGGEIRKLSNSTSKPTVTDDDPIEIVKNESVTVKTNITNSPTPSPTPEPTPTLAPVPRDLVLLDNEYMTVTFEQMYEDEFFKDCAIVRMQLYIVNKSDKELELEFEDVTVNDEMSTIASIYGDVLPHKSRRSIFTLDGSLLSIKTLDEIKIIECSLIIEDCDTYDEVGKAHKIVMDFTGEVDE